MGEAIRCLEANQSQDALRIFDARQAGGPHGLSAALSVSELVKLWYIPVHLVAADARPRNIVEIEQSVEYWARFTSQGGVEPAIELVNVFHCADFVAGLKQLPGRKAPQMANNTIRKHCAAIQTIFDLCGQPDRKFRHALGLLDRVPYITRPPKTKKGAEDHYTYEEFERLLDNADAATRPQGLRCSPGDYMRRVYGFIYYSATRITGPMAARWENDFGDHLLLRARVGVKGKNDHRIEVTPPLRAIIDSMREIVPPELARSQRLKNYDPGRIFPWPWDWPGSSHNLYDEHDLIRACLPMNRQFAFHAGRRLTNNELARLHPKACEKVLGHRTGSINVEAYTAQAIAAEGLAKLRPIAVFQNSQRRLFD